MLIKYFNLRFKSVFRFELIDILNPVEWISQMVLKCHFEQNEETHNYMYMVHIIFNDSFKIKLGNKLNYCCNHISYREWRIAYIILVLFALCIIQFQKANID